MKNIAENDECVLYYDDRGGEDCVISFSHMDFPCDNETYFGHTLFEKLGVSAFGVVAKTNNWFPISVRALAWQAKTLIRRYNVRFCYGFSMGGYGAIKHSRAFSATHVLALSPQWSIDPNDGDLRYSGAFRNDGTQKAIGASDVQGELTIVIDPKHEADVDAARKIASLSPGLRIFPAKEGSGHFTADWAKGRDRFVEVYSGLTAGHRILARPLPTECASRFASVGSD